MPARPTPSAHVAQSVEHFLGKEEVTDSSSVMGSTKETNVHFLTVRCPSG